MLFLLFLEEEKIKIIMAELFRFLMNALFLFWLATSEKWINGKNNSYVGILDMRVNGKFTVYLHVPLYSALTLPSDSECESKSLFFCMICWQLPWHFFSCLYRIQCTVLFSLSEFIHFQLWTVYEEVFVYYSVLITAIVQCLCIFLSTPPAPVYLKTMFIQLQ